ncbi:AbiH family protein [Geojedonia litorea]|uniref:AbiH family protein n=1 Tax=Geojedonia litorea TaxID=1268269 RepID=A0ABV9N268_9FLAO
MRTVLLIGNGFDLAHGAPTSFIDFSEYLLKEVLVPDLISYLNEDGNTAFFEPSIIERSKYCVFTENDLTHSTKWNLFGVLEFDEQKRYEMMLRNMDAWLEHLSNKLLRKLFKEKSKYWFNIEDTFYRYLKVIYHQHKSSNYSDTYLSQLDTLNFEFSEIKNLLKKYLISVVVEKNSSIGLFFENLKKGHNFLNGELVIINFNYTDTIKQYNLSGNSICFYYPIHGTLKDEIIFGYGNDKDKEYQDIKDVGEDKYLEHFKTHKYLLNSVYQNLYREIVTAKEPYEVHVLGHSLGLTDKTLLQELFISTNCKKIHLYKRTDKLGDNSEECNQKQVERAFTTLTMAASRIIPDEIARLKIVNFEDSIYFPST